MHFTGLEAEAVTGLDHPEEEIEDGPDIEIIY